MLRVVCMALMNVIPVVATIFGAAYAVQAAYGIGFAKDIYLWIPVLGNILAVAVIPYVGNLSDRIGRKPPIVVGALASGLLAFGYLYAISIKNVPLAICMSLLMWGVVYQGYNAVFPSFYPELFPTRTRVSAMAISQNLGTAITAMLPALFATVAPPGAANIPLIVGSLAFGITVIAAIAALSARETYRIHMNDLGNPDAVPCPSRTMSGCGSRRWRMRGWRRRWLNTRAISESACRSRGTWDPGARASRLRIATGAAGRHALSRREQGFPQRAARELSQLRPPVPAPARPRSA